MNECRTQNSYVERMCTEMCKKVTHLSIINNYGGSKMDQRGSKLNLSELKVRRTAFKKTKSHLQQLNDLPVGPAIEGRVCDETFLS